MLDRKFILENVALIKANITNRGMKVDVERFVVLEHERRELQKHLETLRAEANALAKNNVLSVEKRRSRGGELKKLEAEVHVKMLPLENEIEAIYAAIPNLTYVGSPVGGEEESADIARGKKEIVKFDFAPADHIVLMENLEMLDLVAGAKVAGSGFYYLTNMGALLELALTRFALDHVMKSGFKPVIPPDLARDSLMQGAGFVPRGNESNTYHLEDSDLNLTATSEITLVGRYAETVVDLSKGPLKVAGISHCFRSERAHGSATRGIYRVHQFTKTEMVVVCLPEHADELHMEMRRLEQEIFDALEIPYRVLEIATGDLGAAAYRKFDLEAWMPMRGGKGDWGEITSTSNCTDFQARRLGIKYRDNNGKLQFAYTLNGTALSVCRAMIALVENHQQPDGSIRIPLVLRPYLGGVEVIQKE